MTTFAEVEKTIEKKIKLLKIMDNETNDIIKKNNLRDIKRHKNLFENKLEEIHDLKTKAIELMLEEDENEAETWGLSMKDKLSDIDNKIDAIEEAIKQLELRNKQQQQREDEETARIQRKAKIKDELELEKAKIEMRQKNEQSSRVTNETTRVKLPKLVISKFQGNYLDWLRFWNEFETEIDKSSIPSVSKFAYLKEMLIPKVRFQVDGLPFNTEGYERAKSILKTTYGKPSEVANAHTQRIIALPNITHHNVNKLHDFYETLVSSVQSLETMKKLDEINGYVRLTLDKLPTIRADLVRLDNNWQEWKFGDLVEALRQWTVRNPTSKPSEQRRDNQNRMFHARNKRHWQTKECVYCGNDEHKSYECREVTHINERKRILSEKRLCFNCISEGHRASDCTSRRGCYSCGQRHHSSICNNGKKDPETNSSWRKDVSIEKKASSSKSFSAPTEKEVIYPVAIVKVNGIKCRALMDTGSGSSYIAASLMDQIGTRPVRWEKRNIEMLMHTVTRSVNIYNVNITNLSEEFQMRTEVTKVDKAELLTLPNPKYEELIKRHHHLRGIKMTEDTDLEELPIHLILGVSEVSKSKTTVKQRIGRMGQPVAEYTHFGWVLTSPGKDGLKAAFMTKSSTEDYEKLYQTDVLGVKEQNAAESVYQDFKEQLTRSEDGWYETSLLWKPNHPPLPNNRKGSLARLHTLLKKLQNNHDLFERYNQVIQDQINQGIVERVTSTDETKGFYLPHRPVIRDDAETTKLRVVYDASARASNNSPSLNDCLETGPSLHNLIWNILVKTRFQPIALTGDLKKAFHQIRVREEDRDFMKFYWIKDLKTQEIDTLRFTRALFGLNQSPFLLGGTLETHLENERSLHATEVIDEIKESTYVDDIITGGNTLLEVKHLKEETKVIYQQGGFQMHKWHSNVQQLEEDQHDSSQTNQSTITSDDRKTKLLGVPWNKDTDQLSIALPESHQSSKNSKREILRTLASVYDPLGIIAPVSLQGKFLYRDSCDSKLSWDEPLPEKLEKKWETFKKTLHANVEIPRTICLSQDSIKHIDLHAFADASKEGTAAVLYAVAEQSSNVNQGLIASSCRLAKKDTTIPRLELTASHMAANLIDNACKVLSRFPVRRIFAWSDSKVALHWIRCEGNYKQYVYNRVKKIRSKEFITWRHVPGIENPADIGSRGCLTHELSDLWWKGPSWLVDEDKWPSDIMTQPTKETEEESKLIKATLNVAMEQPITKQTEISRLMEKFDYKKTMRITTWIMRFITNCRTKGKRNYLQGALTTAEIERANLFWIKTVQKERHNSTRFQADKENLGLEMNEDKIYVCKGRIQGVHPVYIPKESIFAEILVMDAHINTLHGGVGLTMTKIREKYWIPKLRQLTKRIIKKCNGCKRFRAKAFEKQTTGQLPKDRTEGDRPFQVVGLDYAGPITCKTKGKSEEKSYIMLICDSLTRALYLEVLHNQTLEEFLKCFKRFIARKGRPDVVYSDNFSTFTAADRWLTRVLKHEKLHDYLASNSIKWKFNLSKAPWWGGQFERMVAIVKKSLYKTIGSASLTFGELEDVMLDIEIVLNNRPLSYIEDDVQMPILTPNTFVYQSCLLPEEDIDNIDDNDLRKRAKYIKRCKESVWTRWKNEYLTSLRERHKIVHGKENQMKEGDVVIIKGDERNRAVWKLGIIDKLLTGHDGVTRAVRLRAGKSYLERAVQHLYPLELSCDKRKDNNDVRDHDNDNNANEVDAIEQRFRRTPRTAATIAKLKIQDIAKDVDVPPQVE